MSRSHRVNGPQRARRCPRIDRGGDSPQMARAPVEIASGAIVEWQKLRCYNGIMKTKSRSVADLTDEELLEEVKALAGHERATTVRLIASLAELDARQLYLGEG